MFDFHACKAMSHSILETSSVILLFSTAILRFACKTHIDEPTLFTNKIKGFIKPIAKTDLLCFKFVLFHALVSLEDMLFHAVFVLLVIWVRVRVRVRVRVGVIRVKVRVGLRVRVRVTSSFAIRIAKKDLCLSNFLSASTTSLSA
jgi:hypothetical protein